MRQCWPAYALPATHCLLGLHPATELPPLPPVRYGLMSKISTGHSMVDVFLCLLVPMLIRQLLPFLMDVVNRLMRRDGKQEHQFTRHVEHTNRTNYYWW